MKNDIGAYVTCFSALSCSVELARNVVKKNSSDRARIAAVADPTMAPYAFG